VASFWCSNREVSTPDPCSGHQPYRRRSRSPLTIAVFEDTALNTVQVLGLPSADPGRNSKKTRGVKCPTSHVRKALPLNEIKLSLLKRPLRALAVSNVLDYSEPLAGLPQLAFPQSALTVDDTHFAAGTNDAEFYVWVPSTASFLRCPGDRNGRSRHLSLT
jgi:hypothetical protein